MSPRRARTDEEKAADKLVVAVMSRVGATSRDEVECPRERSYMTPCVARDGELAVADDQTCVGCGIKPSDELARLQGGTP